jgi:hypothetical protein
MTKYTQGEHEAMRRRVEQLFRDVASRFEHATVRTDLPGPTGRPGLIGRPPHIPEWRDRYSR